jgi:hypothetical protein
VRALRQDRKKRGIALIAAAFILAGCGFNRAAAEPVVCAAQSRTTLLSVQLRPWAPSPSFVVPAGATVWAQVTKLPVTAQGPLGQPGPVADLHYLTAGSAPRLITSTRGDTTSSDPSFALSGTTGWQRLALPAGNWKVYSNTDPEVELVSCPTQG